MFKVEGTGVQGLGRWVGCVLLFMACRARGLVTNAVDRIVFSLLDPACSGLHHYAETLNSNPVLCFVNTIGALIIRVRSPENLVPIIKAPTLPYCWGVKP